MSSKRVAIYIDGFNLYHSLVEAARTSSLSKGVKWLDVTKVVTGKIAPTKTIISVKYFTALFPNQEKQNRHKRYIRVLEDSGVIVIKGKFKERSKKCHRCNRWFPTHEEKRTDVNIALHLLNDGFKDLYDEAILISGDTDLIPAIKITRENFPHKKIGVFFPYNRENRELKDRRIVDFSNKIKIEDIEASIFSDPYTTRDKKIYTKPLEWS